MKCKTLLVVTVLFMLFTAITFATGQPETGPSKPVTFTIFFHFTPQEARGVVFRDFIKQYNEQNAGKVAIELSYFADWIPMQQKIRTMVAAKQPPDLFYFNFNPNDLSLFQSGELLDFYPYMDDQWKARFHKSDLDMLTYNGKLLAIPVEQGPVVFYYNMSLLQKVGISAVPKTWEDFFELAAKLKDAGIAAASLYTADDAWHATNFFSYFAAEAGGPNVFAIGNPLNSPAIVKAASMLQTLFQYAASDAIGAKWAVSVQDFVTERTAVLVDGPWVIGIVDGQMKDADQVIVAPAPKFSSSDPSVIITDAVTPWSASRHLSKSQIKAVVDFMKVFNSEQIVKRFAIQGKENFAIKMTLTPEDISQAGPKLTANIQLASTADQKVVQVTRVLKPATMNQLPSLVEQLALNKIAPEDFATALQQANEK